MNSRMDQRPKSLLRTSNAKISSDLFMIEKLCTSVTTQCHGIPIHPTFIKFYRRPSCLPLSLTFTHCAPLTPKPVEPAPLVKSYISQLRIGPYIHCERPLKDSRCQQNTLPIGSILQIQFSLPSKTFIWYTVIGVFSFQKSTIPPVGVPLQFCGWPLHFFQRKQDPKNA